MDSFGNDSSSAPDAQPHTFGWRLCLLKRAGRAFDQERELEALSHPKDERDDKDKKPKDKEEGAPAAAPAAAPEVVAETSFGALAQSTPALPEAGDYELTVRSRAPTSPHLARRLGATLPALSASSCRQVWHASGVVKTTAVKVLAAEMSAAHCTLAGSAMHSCKGDGFSASEREAFLVCRDEFGNRVARTGLSSELGVKMRNQDPDGGPEPRADFKEVSPPAIAARSPPDRRPIAARSPPDLRPISRGRLATESTGLPMGSESSAPS